MGGGGKKLAATASEGTPLGLMFQIQRTAEKQEETKARFLSTTVSPNLNHQRLKWTNQNWKRLVSFRDYFAKSTISTIKCPSIWVALSPMLWVDYSCMRHQCVLRILLTDTIPESMTCSCYEIGGFIMEISSPMSIRVGSELKAYQPGLEIV